MMEKQLYAESRKWKHFPLLMLVMIAPLLMGVLCNNGSIPSIITGSAPNRKVVSSIPKLSSFSQLKMLNASNGWATTPNAIVKTADGGKTWTDLTPLDWEPDQTTTSTSTNTNATATPGTTLDIVGADFLDINHAWVVAQKLDGSGNANAAATAISQSATEFATTGTVTANNNDSPQTSSTVYVRSTVDGGRTWMTSNALSVQNLAGISQPNFINEHEGWLELIFPVANSSNYVGDVYRSLDGGVTWTQQGEHQISAQGLLSGLTVVPACVAAGTGNAELSQCQTQTSTASAVQGCTVTGTTNYLGLATATQSKASSLWLDQQPGAGAAWQSTDTLAVPGGAPAQTKNSLIMTSPPIMFQDGTGILPIQMQSDPSGGDPNHLFLHLYGVNLVQAGANAQITDLSPTSSFAVPIISGQHVLSAPDMKHVFVFGQADTQGTYGNWNLYEFNGTNWVTLTSQTDATIPAPAAGQQANVFSPSLSNLDFISDTEGWATDGPNVYHITIANGVATWSQVYPNTGTTGSGSAAVSRQPGKVVSAPTNPPPCGESNNNIVSTGLPPTSSASAELHTFTFVNNTNQTIWVGTDGTTMANHGSWDGQLLAHGSSIAVTVSTPGGSQWSGRFWGRTGCTSGKCDTGDCGIVVLCGTGGVPPATLAEFTLNGAQGLDYYDVSLVDGFNLPMLITSSDGEPSPDNCGNHACIDLNNVCPAPLQELNASGSVVACKSACEALGTDQYCCLHLYGAGVCNPNTWPSDVNSAKLFKSAYPHDYSYAYDDSTSTYTCKTCNFLINFGLTSTTHN